MGMLGLLAPALAHFGLLLFLGAVAVLCIVLGLRNPVLACTYLLIATFFRLAIPSGTFPVDPFVIAFAGVVASTWIWMAPRRRNLSAVEVDPLLCAIVLYITWNVMSMVLPHPYPPEAPLDPAPFSVPRFIVIGTLMPLAMFLVGRWVFIKPARHPGPVMVYGERGRVLGGRQHPPVRGSRAGMAEVHRQPSLISERLGHRGTRGWCVQSAGGQRPGAHRGFPSGDADSVACRRVSLAQGLRGGGSRRQRLRRVPDAYSGGMARVRASRPRRSRCRTGFSQRLRPHARGDGAGGREQLVNLHELGPQRRWRRVAGEVHDRLNTIATSIWAFEQKPLTGWGIGRFAAVNTYHHQQYSPEIPWQRGFGISSHLDALGILVELGIIGLAFWIVVLVLIYTRLVRATRQLPAGEMYGRPLGLTALLCLVAQSTTGLTVDLRFFDFPNIIVMLLAGAAIGWQREQARGTAARHAAHDAAVSSLPHSPVREALRQ